MTTHLPVFAQAHGFLVFAHAHGRVKLVLWAPCKYFLTYLLSYPFSVTMKHFFYKPIPVLYFT